jgi:hypothetical protein
VVFFTVGSAFAFTPSLGIVPDIIIGDQTPIDGLTPGDIVTAGDTIENQLPGANIFDFPNAFDLFGAVRGGGATPDETSDDLLLYEFISSPVQPATGGYTTPGGDPDDRISINGVRILSAALTDASAAIDAASGVLSFKDEAVSSDSDNNAPVVQGSLTYQFGPSPFHPTYTGPFNGLVTNDLVDENMLTLVVTNTGLPLGSNQASDEFVVFTVDNGPDAVSGGLVVEEFFADLSAWAFAAELNTGFGTIDAETGLTTALTPAPADPSLADLQHGTSAIAGNSFSQWGSPPDQIAYIDQGTYRTTWEVNSAGFAAAINTPQQRFRSIYGFFAGLGNTDLVIEPATIPPTVGGSLSYHHLFDHFDNIASANGTTLGLGDFAADVANENAIRLLYDWVDINDTDNEGGGTLELDSLLIQRLDRASLLAQMSTILDVDDFQQGVLVDTAATFDGSTASMIATFPTVDNTPWSVTSSGTATFNGAFSFGGVIDIPMDFTGVGTIPTLGVLPANPDTRIYRTQATVIPSAADIGLFRINAKTFDGLAARLTAETLVRSPRNVSDSGGAGGINPALTVGNPSDFSSYLELPTGLSFGAGPVGDTIQVSVDLIDFDDPFSGGATPVSLDVSRLLMEAGPADLLP